MSWVAITDNDVLRSLTEAERDAVQTAATSPDQDDPVARVIADVVKEIRGYVAACARNTLAQNVTTIPDELKGAAMSRIRFELFTRLPVGRSLLTEDRVDANKAATALFRDVAACKFTVESPATPTTANIPSGNSAQLLRPSSGKSHPFSRMGST